MADPALRCVVFGAGALGLGFLGPELTPAGHLTYLDIPAKADLLGALADAEAYTLNLTGLSVRPVTVGHVCGAVIGSARAAAALQRADLVITAVGEANLRHVAPTLAALALGRSEDRPLRVLCAENGVEIAAGLRAAIREATREDVAGRVRVGDTVMGRMCKIVAEPAAPLAPVAPGLGWGVVAEPYHGIPVEAHAVEGLAGLPPAVRPQGPAEFRGSEDVKMLAHNGLHAVLSCVGHLRGVAFFDELRAHAQLMELGRRLLGEEAAPALLARHRGALDRNELLNYTDWILRRVTCPVLHDPIARGVRDIMRKLAPWERLVHSLRRVSEAGIEPAAYGTGLAAAVRIAREQGTVDGPLRGVLAHVCELDPEADADLVGLIEQRDRALDA